MDARIPVPMSDHKLWPAASYHRFDQIIRQINRTTPKTQSALLEAMEERQVTVEGKTRLIEPPFFVIATQNPSGLFCGVFWHGHICF